MLQVKEYQHVIDFWERFVKSDRFRNNWISDGVNPELQPTVKSYILSLGEPDNILDVGSGPVSILRNLFDDSKITTVDPLGEFYEKMFDFFSYRIVPPISLAGEEINYNCQFSLVHISNALDHCKDPHIVLSNLFKAVTNFGVVLVQGFVNEAEYENYSGLHQWNIDITENGTMTINNEPKKYIPEFYQKVHLSSGKQWFIWAARKQ